MHEQISIREWPWTGQTGRFTAEKGLRTRSGPNIYVLRCIKNGQAYLLNIHFLMILYLECFLLYRSHLEFEFIWKLGIVTCRNNEWTFFLREFLRKKKGIFKFSSTVTWNSNNTKNFSSNHSEIVTIGIYLF